MGKPKKNAGDDAVLSEMMVHPARESEPAKAGTPCEAPKRLEYCPVGDREKWMVERFELLSVEMGLNPHAKDGKDAKIWELEMALFHASASEYSRGWLVVRRLYGVRPIIPPADAHPDDLEVQSREEVCRTLGLEKEQLQAELDAVRARWALAVRANVEEAKETSEPPTSNKDKEELEFGDEVLKEFGFSERMFQLKMYDAVSKLEADRPQEENRAERGWFAQRVDDWKKMLQEPMASALTREALMNDLYLRRLGTEMTTLAPTNPRFETLRKAKAELEQGYQHQLEQLQVMFPELNIAGKVSFKAQIADVIAAYVAYYARKDTARIDRVRTAGEIEVELRQSVQAPEARYRFGLNVAIVEAVHGLYDPNFRSIFRAPTLKKLDEGFREAVERVRQREGEALVNLEEGVMPGEGSEYEDIPE